MALLPAATTPARGVPDVARPTISPEVGRASADETSKDAVIAIAAVEREFMIADIKMVAMMVWGKVVESMQVRK